VIRDRGFFSSPVHYGSHLNHFLAKTTKEVAMLERREPSEQDIAHRAYELYVLRGGEPGTDIEDWLRAEKELAEPIDTPVKTRAARAAKPIDVARK
jgi:hypothetical protein